MATRERSITTRRQMNHSHQRLPLQTFEELKAGMAGRWEEALQELAPSLAEAVQRSPHHVPCPIHGGTDGFRMYRDFRDTGGGVCNTCGPQPSGFALLAWANGYSLKDATREVGQWYRGGSSGQPAGQLRPVRPAPPPPDPTKAYRRIREAWLGSRPLKGTPAEAYLAKRGIWTQNMPAALRFHPGLPWIDPKSKKKVGVFPCLIAPIKDGENRVVSLHRIYLTQDGQKADVPEVKKMMAVAGELRGSAIQLFPASGEVLGLAEGIETALAAHAISRMPVWSTVTARLMESVVIPPHVKKVVIWADLDRSNTGRDTALRVKERLIAEGKEVEIAMPQLEILPGSKGVDWLDVLLTQGIPGFPLEWQKWSEDDLVAAT